MDSAAIQVSLVTQVPVVDLVTAVIQVFLDSVDIAVSLATAE